MPTPPKLTVLLVDDDEDSCDLLAFALERHGHRVSFVRSGEEGLARVLGGEFDVAIYDIGLPDLDGYELARRTKESLAGAAPFVVALTGHARPEDRSAALAAGFDLHLVKPIDVRSIAEVFEHAMQSKRLAPGSD